MSSLLTVTHRKGIYLPEADLWLDPHFGVERAFISHAHSDHVARHELTFCSELTLELMKTRFGLKKGGVFQPLPMREVFEWEGWQLRLLPAGHIVGSAMLHLTRKSDGATLLYTGDYKLRQGLSSERCELLPADTLIMETTFGRPEFHFPPTSETVSAMLRWVSETLEDGDIPVLLGYSLGKAQEILCALAAADLPVMVHPSIFEMTEVVAPLLGKLPRYRLFDPAEARGHVLLFPPTGARSLALRKLKVCRTAMLSGWALQPGAKYRYQVDAVFPLSDHADYPELLETVETVRPKRVYLVHGYTQEFAADLRARGYEAWSLEKANQLEIPLGQTVNTLAAVQAVDSGDEPIYPAASFDRWAQVCAAAARESSRLKKVELFATYLQALEDEESLKLAVRYCAGLLFDPSASEGPLNTGWAVIRRALQEISGLSEVEYRTLSRSQADAGRTAYLVLGRSPLNEPASVELRAMDLFFQALREARGPLLKTKLLSKQLAQWTPQTGSWLVRLMTGELRMGSKEGLIEEAVASAFLQDSNAVREAAMLCGDIGQAAVLAKTGHLHEVEPRLFVPLKVMLASPEETAGDIWQRMVKEASEGETAVWLEDKFDGIRAQLHRSADRVEIYTRDLKAISSQFPEIVQAAQELNEDVILDGEIIAFAEDKKLSFFDLQKRLGRRDQADLFLPSDISVKYVVFDLLWRNEQSLLGECLSVRRQSLEGLLMPAGMVLIEVQGARSEEEIEAAFMAARRRSNEGLIAKDSGSLYSPGRRGKSWLKLKKAFATLDVVVVKAEQGHGKRSHVLSDYTFAVRDEHGALRVIGKAYSGLTDAEIERLTEHFTQTTLEQKGRVRKVIPDTVLEVAFDSIQMSNRHDSGLSLRFPRIKAIRTDKTPEEIDTLAYAQKLAGVVAQ